MGEPNPKSALEDSNTGHVCSSTPLLYPSSTINLCNNPHVVLQKLTTASLPTMVNSTKPPPEVHDTNPSGVAVSNAFPQVKLIRLPLDATALPMPQQKSSVDTSPATMSKSEEKIAVEVHTSPQVMLKRLDVESAKILHSEKSFIDTSLTHAQITEHEANLFPQAKINRFAPDTDASSPKQAVDSSGSIFSHVPVVKLKRLSSDPAANLLTKKRYVDGPSTSDLQCSIMDIGALTRPEKKLQKTASDASGLMPSQKSSGDVYLASNAQVLIEAGSNPHVMLERLPLDISSTLSYKSLVHDVETSSSTEVQVPLVLNTNPTVRLQRLDVKDIKSIPLEKKSLDTSSWSDVHGNAEANVPSSLQPRIILERVSLPHGNRESSPLMMRSSSCPEHDTIEIQVHRAADSLSLKSSEPCILLERLPISVVNMVKPLSRSTEAGNATVSSSAHSSTPVVHRDMQTAIGSSASQNSAPLARIEPSIAVTRLPVHPQSRPLTIPYSPSGKGSPWSPRHVDTARAKSFSSVNNSPPPGQKIAVVLPYQKVRSPVVRLQRLPMSSSRTSRSIEEGRNSVSEVSFPNQTDDDDDERNGDAEISFSQQIEEGETSSNSEISFSQQVGDVGNRAEVEVESLSTARRSLFSEDEVFSHTLPARINDTEPSGCVRLSPQTGRNLVGNLPKSKIATKRKTVESFPQSCYVSVVRIDQDPSQAPLFSPPFRKKIKLDTRLGAVRIQPDPQSPSDDGASDCFVAVSRVDKALRGHCSIQLTTCLLQEMACTQNCRIACC